MDLSNETLRSFLERRLPGLKLGLELTSPEEALDLLAQDSGFGAEMFEARLKNGWPAEIQCLRPARGDADLPAAMRELPYVAVEYARQVGFTRNLVVIIMAPPKTTLVHVRGIGHVFGRDDPNRSTTFGCFGDEGRSTAMQFSLNHVKDASPPYIQLRTITVPVGP